MSAKLLSLMLSRSDSTVDWGFKLGTTASFPSLHVQQVDSESLASQYLDVGDRVIEIEGVDTALLSTEEVNDLLVGARRHLELLVIKKGRPTFSTSVSSTKTTVFPTSSKKEQSPPHETFSKTSREYGSKMSTFSSTENSVSAEKTSSPQIPKYTSSFGTGTAFSKEPKTLTYATESTASESNGYTLASKDNVCNDNQTSISNTELQNLKYNREGSVSTPFQCSSEFTVNNEIQPSASDHLVQQTYKDNYRATSHSYNESPNRGDSQNRNFVNSQILPNFEETSKYESSQSAKSYENSIPCPPALPPKRGNCVASSPPSVPPRLSSRGETNAQLDRSRTPYAQSQIPYRPLIGNNTVLPDQNFNSNVSKNKSSPEYTSSQDSIKNTECSVEKDDVEYFSYESSQVEDPKEGSQVSYKSHKESVSERSTPYILRKNSEQKPTAHAEAAGNNNYCYSNTYTPFESISENKNNSEFSTDQYSTSHYFSNRNFMKEDYYETTGSNTECNYLPSSENVRNYYKIRNESNQLEFDSLSKNEQYDTNPNQNSNDLYKSSSKHDVAYMTSETSNKNKHIGIEKQNRKKSMSQSPSPNQASRQPFRSASLSPQPFRNSKKTDSAFDRESKAGHTQSSIFKNLVDRNNKDKGLDPREEKRKFWEERRKTESVRRFKWGDSIRPNRSLGESVFSGSVENLSRTGLDSLKRPVLRPFTGTTRARSCEPEEPSNTPSPVNTNPFLDRSFSDSDISPDLESMLDDSARGQFKETFSRRLGAFQQRPALLSRNASEIIQEHLQRARSWERMRERATTAADRQAADRATPSGFYDNLPAEEATLDPVDKQFQTIANQQESSEQPDGEFDQCLRQSNQITGGNPGPPAPGCPGNVPSMRIPTEPGWKEPPAAIQNAMMTKDKKPFTYTPGGLDLNEIRSPRMAKRISQNAHTDDSCSAPAPAPSPAPHIQPYQLPPAALAAMQPQIAVAVLPPGGFHMQKNNTEASAAPPPPPPLPAGSAPPPPPPPIPSNGIPALKATTTAASSDAKKPLGPSGRPPPDYLADIPNATLKRVNHYPRSHHEPESNNFPQIQLRQTGLQGKLLNADENKQADAGKEESQFTGNEEKPPSPVEENTKPQTPVKPELKSPQSTSPLPQAQQPTPQQQARDQFKSPGAGINIPDTQQGNKQIPPSPAALKQAPAPWMSTQRTPQKEVPPWASRSPSVEAQPQTPSSKNTPTPPGPKPPTPHQNSPAPYYPQGSPSSMSPDSPQTPQTPQFQRVQPPPFQRPPAPPQSQKPPTPQYPQPNTPQYQHQQPPVYQQPQTSQYEQSQGPQFQPPQYQPPQYQSPQYQQTPAQKPQTMPRPQTPQSSQPKMQNQQVPPFHQNQQNPFANFPPGMYQMPQVFQMGPPQRMQETARASPSSQSGVTRIIPIKVEGREDPVVPQNGTSNGQARNPEASRNNDGRPQMQTQRSWTPTGGAPVQSRSFRVLQKITSTDETDNSNVNYSEPPAYTMPHYPQQRVVSPYDNCVPGESEY